MSTEMEVPPGEAGRIRLFALDLPEDEARRFAEEAPGSIAAALGLDELGVRHVEVFDTRDLSGVGLAGYLSDGLGVDADELKSDRARLDAVQGWVAAVMSGAFRGRGGRVRVEAPLRWLGTWSEAGADTPEIELKTASAEGELSGGGPTAASSPNRAALWAVAVLIALGLILAFVLF